MVSLIKQIQHALLKKAALCLAFIGLLTVSAHAQLGGPPSITVQPAVLSVGGIVTNGGIAVINATVTSLTSLKLTWYCNGYPVSSSSKYSIANVNVPLVGTVSTLTITGVSSNDAGSYSLRATNAVGSAVSSNATLIVQNLINTVVTNVVNVVSFVSAGTSMTVNGFNIKLSGPTGSNVVIQASSDLKTWMPISTNLVSSGSVSYTDTSAKVRPLRYYRAFIQ